MQIKICGLKRLQDVEYVNAARPDYVGFVFAGSKRRIDDDTAGRLKAALRPEIPTVGVFVNEDPEHVLALVRDGILDVVQLHGDETESYVRRLCRLVEDTGRNVPVIRAVRVHSTDQILEAEKLPVRYLLLDAFEKDVYGGSGRVFDHTLIPQLDKPYFLAGGINEENVSDILQTLADLHKLPTCVDVSSGVETDGVKDGEKIMRLVEMVHRFPAAI